MTDQEVIRQITLQGEQITNQILTDLMNENITKANKAYKLNEIYKGNVDINNRTFTDTNKINSKLAADFAGEIVDQVNGYMFGNAVVYEYVSDKLPEASVNTINEKLQDFANLNNLNDLDNQTGTLASNCGRAGRLLYIDKNGNERVMSLNPWEYFIIKDQSIEETQYAVRWYPIEIINDKGRQWKVKIEWYDKENVTFYIGDSNYFVQSVFSNTASVNVSANISNNYVSNFILDPDEPARPHLFDYVPIIDYPNNHAMQGDFEKVLEYINAYDRTVSDAQNEFEEFRIAYLAIYGATISPEERLNARLTGTINVPDKETGIEWLTKDINTEFLEQHKKTLKENIYRHSKSVDMSDESFSGGSQSGESRKYKLIALENKAKTKEIKFKKSNIELFRCLFSAWAKKYSITANPIEVKQTFTRNLPIELTTSAQVATQLKTAGFPDKIIYSLMPFIENVDEALAMKEEETQNSIDLQNYMAEMNSNNNQDNQQGGKQ